MRKKTWATGVLTGAVAVTAMAVAAAVPAASAATKTAASTLAPPPVKILTNTAGNKGGDIFISPFGDATTYANGAEILSPNGKKVVWFHRAPAGQEDADFRTQTYDGKPVLTFWQGTGLGGVSTGDSTGAVGSTQLLSASGPVTLPGKSDPLPLGLYLLAAAFVLLIVFAPPTVAVAMRSRERGRRSG